MWRDKALEKEAKLALRDAEREEERKKKLNTSTDEHSPDDKATSSAQAMEVEGKMALRDAERSITIDAEAADDVVSRMRSNSRRLSGLGGVPEDLTHAALRQGEAEEVNPARQLAIALALLSFSLIFIAGNLAILVLTLYFLVINESQGGSCVSSTGRAIWLYAILRICLNCVANQCKVKEPTEDNKTEQNIALCCSTTIIVGSWIYGGVVIYASGVCDQFKNTGLYKLISAVYIIEVSLGCLNYMFYLYTLYSTYTSGNQTPLPPQEAQRMLMLEDSQQGQNEEHSQPSQTGVTIEKVQTSPEA